MKTWIEAMGAMTVALAMVITACGASPKGGDGDGDDDDDRADSGGGGEGGASSGSAAPPLCSDDCQFAADGVCDDGGPDAAYLDCLYGTDCTDCGPRDPAGGAMTTTTTTTTTSTSTTTTTSTTSTGGGGEVCAEPGASCVPCNGCEPDFYDAGNCCNDPDYSTFCGPVNGQWNCCLAVGTAGCDEVPCCDGVGVYCYLNPEDGSTSCQQD
jgi:hypothetical protein